MSQLAVAFVEPEVEARHVIACSACGADIVTERDESGTSSDYRDKRGRCFRCAWGRSKGRP